MADHGEIRTALIGFGLAGSVFHAPLIAATAGLRLTTIATSDPGRQRQARHEHPGAAVVARISDFDSLARDHDLVVVATSNRTHVPLARGAIEAGLAVVVEKPMAPTAAEASDLIELARRRGVALTVFHNRRWDTEILTLERLLAEGRLGTVTSMESRFERWRPEVSRRWRESAAPEDAGGVLLDLGTHLVDQALHLFGATTHVYAEVNSRRPGSAVDDDDLVVLRHASGVSSCLWMSLVAAETGPRLRVRGGRAGFVVANMDGQEDALRSGARPGDAASWGNEPRHRWGMLVDGTTSAPVPAVPGNWPAFYARLVSALRGDGPLPVAAEDGLAVLQVLEAARVSSQAAQVVSTAWS